MSHKTGGQTKQIPLKMATTRYKYLQSLEGIRDQSLEERKDIHQAGCSNFPFQIFIC